ncbi:MAG: hypothetical protein Aurels2KO_32910 [Aureliella sp.]
MLPSPIPMLLGQTEVSYQWLRLEQLDQWWHWLTLAVVVVILGGFTFLLYRRDSHELPRQVRTALLVLRIAALLGLLLHFFHLEKRSQRRVVRQSRLAVLVDTSVSMSLPSATATGSFTRSDQATRLLAESPLLEQLSSQHELTIYRYGAQTQPTVIAAINRSGDTQVEQEEASGDQLARLTIGRRFAWVAVALFALTILCSVMSTVGQFAGLRTSAFLHWSVLVGAASLIVALLSAATAIFPNTSFTLASLISSRAEPSVPPSERAGADVVDQATSEEESSTVPSLPEEWAAVLQPTGAQSRLGDAVAAVLEQEVGNPLAGIVLLTDGQSNSGIAARQAASRAATARVPLHFIGLGSPDSPQNVRVVDIDVPKRLYPGDRFTLRALIGNESMEGEVVSVQVLSGPKDSDQAGMTIATEQQLTLPDDGSIGTVEFQLDPRTVGEWDYVVNVIPNKPDADARDNADRRLVEVVQRKTRVLIIAGGPTREYQFVRNLLYRDRDIDSHVFLQTATPMSSQEAQQMLESFPADRVELGNYDAVLAFDPDWTKIPASSVVALEQWVAEQAGGFLMVAGTVEMPKWVSRSASGIATDKLRNLSPVVLPVRGSRLTAAGRIEAEASWPLTITKEGEQTEFMSVADDAQLSQRVWESFAGVYGFYSAYELKPGAKALAYFSDPRAMVGGSLPIYLATQFYGSGRTAFLGGGELWRIRSQGDAYFDRFYIKLVRWISQGRLLLDSDRGVLLVDRERGALGEQVAVRAVVKTAQYEPLIQSELVARLIDTNGRNVPLVLRPLADGAQPGIYTGQFPLLVAGDYTIQVQLDGIASETLQATVRASVPAQELENAERNDTLMKQLAVDTGGGFWPGPPSIAAPDNADGNESDMNTADGEVLALAKALPAQDTIAFIPGSSDPIFQVRWLGWLMSWIASCLALEWLTRRAYRLA